MSKAMKLDVATGEWATETRVIRTSLGIVEVRDDSEDMVAHMGFCWPAKAAKLESLTSVERVLWDALWDAVREADDRADDRDDADRDALAAEAEG